jgi:shikimate dehydrogenase
VTSPFKERVIEHLEYISGDAQDANSVNIIVGGKGRLRGYNADIEGFMSPFDFLSEIKWENEKLNLPPTALILGSGGAASAAAVGLVRTWGTGRLVFLARNPDKLRKRLDHFQRRYAESHIEFIPSSSPEEARKELFHKDKSLRLLINATPIGQWPQAGDDPFEPFGLNDEDLIEFKYYYDAVYNPMYTAGMKRMSSLGAGGIGGVDWFCRQAVLSAEIFFDHRPSEDEARRFVETELLRA